MRCWRSRTKPWWERHTGMLQTAGRVGGDPAAQDSGKREAAPPPLTSIRFGWVDGGGRPWPLSKQRPWTESRGVSGLFPGTAVPRTAKIPVGVGGQFGGFGLWPSLSAGGGINPGWINQGPSAVPREHNPQSNLHAANPGSNTYLRENATTGRGWQLGKLGWGAGEGSLQLRAGPRSTLSSSPVARGSG